MKYRYPGIHAFTVENSALFCGRKTDEERFYALLRLERLVVLYGKSGYGKTSLLQAAVLPRLERETDYVALRIRFRSNAPGFPSPVNRTAEIITEWLRQQKTAGEKHNWFSDLLPGIDTLWYQLKRAQALTGRKRFVLVFDQFEEIFTYPEMAVTQFRAQLAELLYTRIPQEYRDAWNRLAGTAPATQLPETAESFFFDDLDVRAVFSLRTDYMHYLNRMKDYLPLILRHCYELDALTFEQARQAITEPAAKTDLAGYTPPFAYSEKAVELLLEYLSNRRKEKIESFQLQLICRHIEAELVEKKNKTAIDVTDFGPNPDARMDYFRQVNRDYYQSSIASIQPPALQAAARKIIENELIIPNEKRRATVDGGLLIARYADQGATEALLEQLKNTYLVRAEKSERGTLYELSHDALIEPLLRAREERELRELRNKQRKERLRITLVALFLGGIALIYNRLWANASDLADKNIRLVDSLENTLELLTTEKKAKERSISELQTSNSALIRWQLDLAERQILTLNYEGCLKNLRLAIRQAEDIARILPEGQNNHDDLKRIGEAMLEPCFFYVETGNITRGMEILDEIGRLTRNAGLAATARYQANGQNMPAVRRNIHRAMSDAMPERFRFLWNRYYPVMKKVGGGDFTMGCDPTVIGTDFNPENPESSKRRAVVDAFQIAESETTVWQYNLFKTAAQEQFTGRNLLGDRPCGYVPWKDALRYANWLSLQHNLSPAYSSGVGEAAVWNQSAPGYRLPTEAEWELAARGGIPGIKDTFKFSGSNALHRVGWFAKNAAPSGIPAPKAVKTKQPNRLGLYDMSGNLSEWCWDTIPARRVNMKNDRVLKGGSFKDWESKCMVFNRGQYGESAPPNEEIGFRVVRR